MSKRMRRVAGAVACLVALMVMAAGGFATAAGGAEAEADWKIGDCYAEADVDSDDVDLSSKVPCTKDHAVQVIGGGALSATLVAAGRPALASIYSSARPALVAFAESTCSPPAVVGNLYPKIGKKLANLMFTNDVIEWVPPVAGRTGWVLPDQASFDAGATDLLCIFEPDATVGKSASSDLVLISTKDPLPTSRLCFDFSEDRADYVSCGKPHDEESLIWISQDVSDRPVDVTAWTDEDWAPYDAACVEFGKAVIGAQRADLIVRADTDTDKSPDASGRRLINCVTYPKKESLKLPGGFTVTGAGTSKIGFVKAST